MVSGKIRADKEHYPLPMIRWFATRKILFILYMAVRKCIFENDLIQFRNGLIQFLISTHLAWRLQEPCRGVSQVCKIEKQAEVPNAKHGAVRAFICRPAIGRRVTVFGAVR